jgi:16S rRNA (guanine527-N7)-methyltransferase
MISDSRIANALTPYGISAQPELCESIRTYISLLLRWNERISLTTITDPEEILKLHFGESFFAVSAVPIQNGRLADVGSGAGFPGIPLAMAAPDLNVTLIESNLKKSAFLSEVIRSLRLNQVRVIRSRMEEVPLDLPAFDFVTVRAVGHHRDLLSWAESSLSESGKIVLWVGEADAIEISRSIAWVWRSPIHIPGSRSRVLLVGAPKSSK